MTLFKRIPSVFWIVLLWWTAYALIFATQVMLMEEQQGRPIAWQQALKFSFGGWMTWVPLSLGLYWLVRRHAIERGHVLRALVVLNLAALAVVLLRAVYVYASNPVFAWYGDDPLPSFGSVLTTAFINNFMLAWLVIGIAHAMVFYQRSHERGQKVAELESNLTRTRLDALRSQLNPHFLFNALNSVAEMVHRDADLADRMLVALAAMLRDSLSSEQDQLRPLRDELALVEHYLMIEKIRLGDRLQLGWDVAPGSLDAQVPALILQPLVENAIVHGIARRRAPGLLQVRAGVDGGQLWLEVHNSAAPDDSVSPGTGIGLQSTRSRLQLLYGDRAGLLRERTVDGDHRVRLVVPQGMALRPSAAADTRAPSGRSR
ncbi:sensor histidine kinase [Luteimonas sp. RIT-PG2_3]